MSSTRKAQWQMHFCVLLWGFTAILGKLITLPALPLVWWRVVFVSLALLLMPRVWRGLRALSFRLAAAYAGVGLLVTLHWLTFYAAIKLANASVAVTCMALGTAFLAMFEPWLSGKRFDPRELVLGIAVVPGVALVVGGVPSGMHWGIVVGIVSALLVALFGVFNKQLVEHADPLTVTFVELGAGACFLSLLAIPLSMFGLLDSMSGHFLPGLRDTVLLFLLATACTLLPFVLSLVALRHLSAFQAQLAVNLEPVYAILLAVLFLDEQHELSAKFYLGVAIILVAVFAHPLIARRESPPPII